MQNLLKKEHIGKVNDLDIKDSQDIDNNRKKLFLRNSIYSVLQQLVAVVCGLILPRMILGHYGSAVNGAITSITQFLSFITLLQGGIGTVARLAYYKPLADRDYNEISIAYKTVNVFFRKFSIVFSVYLVVLAIVLPLIIHTKLNYSYLFFLTIIVGLASISEYFFGQASQILLFSDQRGYIYSIIQVVCLFVSTILCGLLININCSIHYVKLIYAIVFTIRPLVLYYYVRNRYKIDINVKTNEKMLDQKNAAFVRHIAFYIHTSTDVMLLTLIKDVLWVSVYSVHMYVVNCVTNLLSTVFGNVEVVFGNMFARKEFDILKKEIPIYDLFIKVLSNIFFTTCMVLITNFVSIYTKNVSDVNYNQPLFAIVITMAEYIYLSGNAYQSVYIAAGHIKKTEWIAIAEACINIFISLILINKLNLLGVAIGTMAAMVFKSIANIYYMQRNVIKIPLLYIIKSYIANFGCSIVIVMIFSYFKPYIPHNYMTFFIYALIVFLAISLFVYIVNFIAFPEYMKDVTRKVIVKFFDRKK